MIENTTSRRLSEREAAAYLGPVSVRTLQDWRGCGVGPSFIKLGGRVAYDTADLDEWIAARRVEPKQTADSAILNRDGGRRPRKVASTMLRC